MDKICDRDEVREGSVLIVTTDHGSYELELENSIKACLRRKRITLIVAITSWDTEDSKEAKYLSLETMRSLKRLVSYSRSGHHKALHENQRYLVIKMALEVFLLKIQRI